MSYADAVLKKKVTHVRQHAFIKEHFLGVGKDSAILGWLVCYDFFHIKLYQLHFDGRFRLINFFFLDKKYEGHTNMVPEREYNPCT